MSKTKQNPISFLHSLFVNHIFIVAISLITTTSHVYSQNLKHFQGSYLLYEAFKGEADFYYTLKNADTVFQGKFMFKDVYKDTLEKTVYKSKEFIGEFKSNKKNGPWSYSHKAFESTSKQSIDGLYLIQKVNGSDYSILANFTNGIASGTWQVIKRTIANSQATDTLFAINTQYKNGLMFGEINGSSDNLSLNGFFDDNGFIHGKWTLLHQNDASQIKELREYQNGILMKHQFEINKIVYDIDYVGLKQTVNEDDNWIETDIDSAYFNLLQTCFNEVKDNANSLTESNQINSLFNKSNQFIQSALFSFGEHNKRKVWDLTIGSEALKYAKIRVLENPFTSKEKETLKSAKNTLVKAKQSIDTFFGDKQVELGKHSYKELSKMYEAMTVYKFKVKSLSNWVQEINSSSFEHIDRDAVFSKKSPSVNYPELIKYEFKDESYNEKYAFPPNLDAGNTSIELLSKHIEQIFADIKNIEKSSEKILESYRKQSKLKEQEANLVIKKDSILQLFTPEELPKNYNQYHQNLASPLALYVQKTFKTYANSEFETKSVFIDSLNTCFDNLIELYHTLDELPKRVKRLDEVYTRTIWNPYTFTDMDERVKERVYRAFENILLPKLLQQVQNFENCANFDKYNQNFKNLYRSMILIRDRDTKEAERLLRRETNPTEIAKILNIELYID